ncbi:MAG: hypothetical protein IPK72_25375 [Candidatus Eisenbacteria bacterium]|nr:hypothetical protein [Candidatus Eisenbacteria bacterium]
MDRSCLPHCAHRSTPSTRGRWAVPSARLAAALLLATPLAVPAAAPQLLLDQVIGSSRIESPVRRNASTFVGIEGPNYGIARYHPTAGWSVITAPPMKSEVYPLLVGDQVYFWGTPSYVDDRRRLYRVDGDTAVELAVTSDPSSDREIRSLNGLALFVLGDPAHGTELWVSDGTPGGTELLLDLNPSGSSVPRLGAASAGYIYFRAYDPTHGSELWRTDGTPGGTTLVADLVPGVDGSFPDDFTEVNGLVVFTARTSVVGEELHRTDGTSAGTYLIRDLYPGVWGSDPAQLASIDGWVYFAARTPTEGIEPHRTNGNVIQLVRDVDPGAAWSWPSGFFGYDGEVYFAAFQDATGFELWKTNGLSSGTSLVLDASPGIGSVAPHSFREVDGVLYYLGYRDGGSNELWRTEGTGGSTSRIVLYPGVEEEVSAFFDDGSRLIVGANDGTTVGHEPRRYNPANGNLTLSADLNPESDANNEMLAPYGDDLLAVQESYLHGRDLSLYFLNDLDASGSFDTGGGRESNFPVGAKYAISGEMLYFIQWQIDLGLEIAVWDGDDLYEIDLFAGPEGSEPSDLAVTADGRCFFIARRDDGATYGLYRLTPPPNPTPVLVASFGDITPRDLVALGNQVVFVATDPGGGEDLWVSNGTQARRILDIEPGPGTAAPADLTVVGDQLYFTAATAAAGRELWVTDGSEEGTHLVTDLVPGPASSGVGQLTAGLPYLYLTATTSATGLELWRATSAGIEALAEIVPGPGSGTPTDLAFCGSRLRFSADDGSGRGREPWSLTGERTPVLTFDLNPGAGSSNPRDFGDHLGATYFTADNGSFGRELWRVAGGTLEAVSESIVPGAASSAVGDRATVGSKLYFVAESAAFGREIWWVSDPGGAADTPTAPMLLTPPAPGLALSVGPNPFVDQLDLRFRLPQASPVRVSLIDVGGRELERRSFTHLDVGAHQIPWPINHPTARRGAGVLFVRIEAAGLTEVRKVLRVR